MPELFAILIIIDGIAIAINAITIILHCHYFALTGAYI